MQRGSTAGESSVPSSRSCCRSRARALPFRPACSSFRPGRRCCGKTTALRMLAGLEQLDKGDIRIDGKSVVALEPKDRDVALVFQSYALYPHMTVRDNIQYPLKVRRQTAAERSSKVERAAKLLRIEHLLPRKPAQLSGGEQQRVALARAIVREPRVF